MAGYLNDVGADIDTLDILELGSQVISAGALADTGRRIHEKEEPESDGDDQGTDRCLHQVLLHGSGLHG